MNQPTKESFLKDVSDFEIKLLKEDGVYRHIHCQNKNGSSNHYFDIVTWPGYLSYTGDMGAFTFERCHDMLEFFNAKEINAHYWSEKVQAENVHGGIRQFDIEKFRECVLEDTRTYLELNEDQEIPEEVMDEIECLLEAEDEFEAVYEIRDFSSDLVDFTDFWEHTLTSGTYHYIWCCYALNWVSNEYFKNK